MAAFDAIWIAELAPHIRDLKLMALINLSVVKAGS